MTALCGGGTSAPTFGAAAVTDVGSAAAALYLDKYGAGFLTPAIPFLGLGPLTLSTFCSTDPPAVPTFTSDEANALLHLNFGADFDSGLAKFKDQVLHYAWLDLCVCTTGGPATQPSAFAPPAGTAVPANPTPGSTPCASDDSPQLACSSDVAVTFVFSNNASSGGFPAVVVPVGATVVRLVGHNIITGSNPDSIDYFYYYYTATNGGGHVGGNFTVASGGTGGVDWVLPAGTVGFSVNCARHTSGSNNSNLAQLRYEVYCGGVPGQPNSPCCPPDAVTTAKFDALLAMVTLIQRQVAPFAYVSGQVHSALTGTGTFSLASSLGLLLNVSVPARAGRDAGTPETVFNCGWINFATLDGYGERFFITTESQIVLPRLPGLYTDVGYSFAPDVTVTATELAREP